MTRTDGAAAGSSSPQPPVGYTTASAEDLVDTLVCRLAMFEERAGKQDEPYARGLNEGWRAATERALEDARRALPKVERDARLIPEQEEQYGSLRERLIAEEMAA